MKKHTVLFVILMVGITGCASNKEPTFGDTLQREGKNRTDLGKQWSKGQLMIKDGNKLIKKGQKQITSGNNNVSKGELMIIQGEELSRQVEQAYRQSRNW